MWSPTIKPLGVKRLLMTAVALGTGLGVGVGVGIGVGAKVAGHQSSGWGDQVSSLEGDPAGESEGPIGVAAAAAEGDAGAWSEQAPASPIRAAAAIGTRFRAAKLLIWFIPNASYDGALPVSPPVRSRKLAE
jgi:hypothetical protein